MKLSVAIITYNHENFIAQAIDSVLKQDTSFDYEIVIGEDCSTDKTREIVINYQKKYPDKIKALLPEKNLGITKASRFSGCKS
jgi:glycosyltransferase involved in cell wall biosynthesis